MDSIDAKILKILSKQADVTATEISESVNLSVPAVNKRIQKLKKDGMIRRYTVLTNGKNIGKPIMAFVLLVVQAGRQGEPFLEYVKNDDDILECFSVTGEYDYLIKVCAADMGSLKNKLSQIKLHNGVVKSHTMISLLEQKFSPTILPTIKDMEE
ncbi:MAG: Lrp/AsnC family transcriptional regulator [Clostridia bacterium]|jgi:Lrp/AsnC family leucine-responsive transcriptional regulator|nr:Lrp/AsnC family transcriptional regulator [Clostridia bacterium]